MRRLPGIDLAVLVGYLAVTVGLGCSFATRNVGTDGFMAGGRSMPGFSYFIANLLPVGLSGVVVATIFAASMDSGSHLSL